MPRRFFHISDPGNSGKCPDARYGAAMSAPIITPESSMGSILDALPGGRRALFARYHLGGCQSCGFPPEETLASLCARSGKLPVQEVIDHLLASHSHDEAMLVTPAEARETLAQSPDTLLLDTRTREEFDAVRLPAAQFLTQDLQQSIFGGPPERTVFLCDHTGRHVLDLVAWFRGHGLKNTFGIRGGIDAWSRELDPSLPRYRLEIDADPAPGKSLH